MSFITCTKCKESKLHSEYYPSYKTRKINKLQSWCKACSRISSNAAVKERGKEVRNKLNEIKLSSGCVDCGYNKAPEALDFDHIKDKSFGLSYSMNKPWEEIFNEIEKCEIVCANCHRIRTKNRKCLSDQYKQR